MPKNREKTKANKIKGREDLLETTNIYSVKDLTAYSAVLHIVKGGSIEDNITLKTGKL